MNPSCAAIAPLIDDLLTGDLAAPGMATLQNHLAACAGCKQRLAARFREDRALRELGALAHGDRLARRIQAALGGEVPLPPPGTVVKPAPMRGWFRPSAHRAGLVAALVLLAVGVSWWWTSGPQPVARIESVRGTVQVQTAAGPQTVAAGARLYPGQSLATGIDSAARLTLPDRSNLELGAETVLARLSPEGQEVVLNQGLLTADVRPRTPGQSLVCRTPHGTATVVGTSLSLAVVASATQLEVKEGTVQLARSGKTMDVAAGFYAVAADALDLTPRRLTAALAALPPGAVVRYHEDFSTEATGWQGSRRTPPGATSDFAVLAGPVSTREFRKTLFGELRSPWQKDGWRVGPHAYLRFRYYAEGFVPKQGIWMTIKRKDENNFGLSVKAVVPNHWQTVTLRLSDFAFVLRPELYIAAGEALHQLAWFAAANGTSPAASARLWIDDVVLFETPQALAPGDLTDAVLDN